MSTTAGARHITGMGCIENGAVERMCRLTDIDALTGNAEMVFMGATVH